MGIAGLFSDLMAGLGFHEAHGEAPAEEEENKEDGADVGGEKSEEGSEEGAGGDGGGEEESGAEVEAEAEEEDDEPVDPKPKLEEECARSAQCAPYRHHFDECVERVTAMGEDPEYKGPNEDCVEEFFHLQHCATTCAAPKLFRALK